MISKIILINVVFIDDYEMGRVVRKPYLAYANNKGANEPVYLPSGLTLGRS